MPQANATPPELLMLNRRLKAAGLRAVSITTYNKIVQHIRADDLLDMASQAMHDESSRQWLMTIVSRGEKATGDIPVRSSEGDNNWKPLTVHVYGAQAALCFEPTESASRFPTIAIDAALKVSNARKYDWSDKIQINLTRSELVEVASTLLGFSQSAEGKHHGPAKNKGFRITNQDRHFFFEVFEGDKKKRGVQILPADAHYVASLILRQLRGASPWMTVTDVVTMLRCRSPMLKPIER